MSTATAPQPDNKPDTPLIRRMIPGEHLTFRIGSEEYGIDILCVQEIRSYEPPTRIANAPPQVTGVVDLRGVVVPIVDLRMKLGCGSIEYNDSTVVIVLFVRDQVIGVVVDSVSDVVRLDNDAIRPPPQMDQHLNASYVTGIGMVRQDDRSRMLILLDIEALLSW